MLINHPEDAPTTCLGLTCKNFYEAYKDTRRGQTTGTASQGILQNFDDRWLFVSLGTLLTAWESRIERLVYSRSKGKWIGRDKWLLLQKVSKTEPEQFFKALTGLNTYDLDGFASLMKVSS